MDWIRFKSGSVVFSTHLTMTKTLAVLIFFVAAVLSGLFFRMSLPEHFMQRDQGMPVDMVAAKGVEGMAAASPILGMEPKPVSLQPYATTEDAQLSMFSRNKIGAECCPSPFVSGGGCVCLTAEQKAVFASRGGNRTV